MIGAVSHIKSVTIADGTNSDIVRPSDWNSGHNGALTISGQTAGASTWSGTNLVLQFGGDLTGSINGNTLLMQDTEAKRSYWAQAVVGGGQTPANMSMIGNSSNVFPFFLPYDISADFVRFPVFFAVGANSAATVANSTGSGGISTTFQYVLYSMGTGASSQSLLSIASGSVLSAVRNSFAMNSTGSQYSQTYEYTYPILGTTSQSTTQGSQSTSNLSFLSTQLTALSGARLLDIPFSASLSAGPYWMALGLSTTTGGNSKGTRVRLDINSFYAATMSNATFGVMGSSSGGAFVGGVYSNANASTTSAIALSELSYITHGILFPIQFIRSA